MAYRSSSCSLKVAPRRSATWAVWQFSDARRIVERKVCGGGPAPARALLAKGTKVVITGRRPDALARAMLPGLKAALEKTVKD